MGRPKQAKYFSDRFFDLAEEITKHPEEPIVVDFPTVAGARDFRMEFYTFRSRAEAEGQTLMYPELCAITVKLEGQTLTFQHKNYTPGALALDAALKKRKERT